MRKKEPRREITAMSTIDKIDKLAPPGRYDTEYSHDAHRDVLIAVQRVLATTWHDDRPRIAVIEHDGPLTVYVSATRLLEPSARETIRDAVRDALGPYTALAPYANVVFLRRGAA